MILTRYRVLPLQIVYGWIIKTVLSFFLSFSPLFGTLPPSKGPDPGWFVKNVEINIRY
jgi:hypothetical protein